MRGGAQLVWPLVKSARQAHGWGRMALRVVRISYARTQSNRKVRGVPAAIICSTRCE